MKSREDRDAAGRALTEEAYREVYQIEHPDSFNLLFKFPDWVPGYFVSVHRRRLSKLLKAYSRDEIATDYENYKARLTNDHAKHKHAGAWWSPAILPPLNDEFRELAHVLWALEIGEVKGSDAGLAVLLGDPEEARYWRQGKKNVAAVKRGGAAKRDNYMPKNQLMAQKFRNEIIQYRERYRTQNFTAACRHVAKENECSESQIRKLLKLVGIRATTYKAAAG